MYCYPDIAFFTIKMKDMIYLYLKQNFELKLSIY
jgi:hypothetical protein